MDFNKVYKLDNHKLASVNATMAMPEYAGDTLFEQNHFVSNCLATKYCSYVID